MEDVGGSIMKYAEDKILGSGKKIKFIRLLSNQPVILGYHGPLYNNTFKNIYKSFVFFLRCF